MVASEQDLFADIRAHADGGAKFLQENVVLAAVEEILTAQGLTPTPIAYLGALMTSLQSQGGTEPAVYAGVLTLLDRCLARVPRPLLLSKAARISSALVGVANAHTEHAPVLRGALTCVLHVLGAHSGGGPPTADVLKFIVHPNPKVRARGHVACVAALESCPKLSEAAAKFVEERLTAAALKDVQPALYVLNFLRQALGYFEPKPLSVAAHPRPRPRPRPHL